MVRGRGIVATLVDQRETNSRLGGRFEDCRCAGRNEWRMKGGDDEGESVERGSLLVVGTFDFTGAGDIHMVVMMRGEMGVD